MLSINAKLLCFALLERALASVDDTSCSNLKRRRTDDIQEIPPAKQHPSDATGLYQHETINFFNETTYNYYDNPRRSSLLGECSVNTNYRRFEPGRKNNVEPNNSKTGKCDVDGSRSEAAVGESPSLPGEFSSSGNFIDYIANDQTSVLNTTEELHASNNLILDVPQKNESSSDVDDGGAPLLNIAEGRACSGGSPDTTDYSYLLCDETLDDSSGGSLIDEEETEIVSEGLLKSPIDMVEVPYSSDGFVQQEIAEDLPYNYSNADFIRIFTTCPSPIFTFDSIRIRFGTGLLAQLSTDEFIRVLSTLLRKELVLHPAERKNLVEMLFGHIDFLLEKRLNNSQVVEIVKNIMKSEVPECFEQVFLTCKTRNKFSIDEQREMVGDVLVFLPVTCKVKEKYKRETLVMLYLFVLNKDGDNSAICEVLKMCIIKRYGSTSLPSFNNVAL